MPKGQSPRVAATSKSTFHGHQLLHSTRAVRQELHQAFPTYWKDLESCRALECPTLSKVISLSLAPKLHLRNSIPLETEMPSRPILQSYAAAVQLRRNLQTRILSVKSKNQKNNYRRVVISEQL